jgi:hypothetical protein
MIKLFYSFLLHQLFVIHSGVWYAKIKASFFLGATLTPFALILQKFLDWYIINQVTIFFISGAVLCDWFGGIIKHIMLKSFSWKENGKGLLIKVAMVVISSFLAEGLIHFLGNNFLSTALITALRLSTFMYPAGSCWMNMNIITKGLFPPIGLINRIKSFNQNLNIKELTDGPTNQT